jgi:thiamine-phosphate pyrophosphorylase
MWKKKRLNNSRLYLILDKEACGKKNMGTILKRAIFGGVDIIQFRDKISSTGAFVRYASGLLKIAKKSGIPFIVNDRIDVALAIGADGVHLGPDDMPVKAARKILTRKSIIGLSCRNISDIKLGERQKADYLGLGPVFRSKTKNARPPLGPNTFKKALFKSHLPLFAIGGITENNLKNMGKLNEIKNKFRIAVCRELCLSPDPAKTAKQLKDSLK